jgi:tetratricopeptide (TPR) repeat protein
MMVVMNQDRIEHYLKIAQVLAIRQSKGTSNNTFQETLYLIEGCQKEWDQEESYQEFFEGEKAFYKQEFEEAVRHYLKASALIMHPFFCYRASAYLFHDQKNLDKALSYAYRALKMRSDDYMTLSLLEKLLKLDQKKEDAQEIHHKLIALEKEAENISISNLQKISNSKEEVERNFKNSVVSSNDEKELSNKLCPLLQVASCSLEKTSSPNPGQITEPCMNTESDIFSSPQTRDIESSQTLTRRLYTEQAHDSSFDSKLPKTFHEAIDNLKKLAHSDVPREDSFLSPNLSNDTGLETCCDNPLEQRIHTFQNTQANWIKKYLDQVHSRQLPEDDCLYYLNGWSIETDSWDQGFLAEQSRQTTGGIYVRWKGKGIVINPGQGFLQHFHKQGLHIRDIDFVIVTDDNSKNYAEAKDIYDLTYQLNKISSDLQIIQYYFSQKAFQDLSRILKPHFKQERHILHSLELFLDSPDVEKIDLAEGIILNYFRTGSRHPLGSSLPKEDKISPSSSGLGIRLDLKAPSNSTSEDSSVKLGYLCAYAAWNPLLAHYLGHCNLVVTGFGNTTPQDFNRLSYHPEFLGYYGNLTLLEETNPTLFLIGEFGGREGDIRLEAIKKIKQDHSARAAKTSRPLAAILPADVGLCLNLNALQVKCSITQTWVNPHHIKVIKTIDAFGSLKYLSPSCFYD